MQAVKYIPHTMVSLITLLHSLATCGWAMPVSIVKSYTCTNACHAGWSDTRLLHAGGGLLAGVAADRAGACLEELLSLGYTAAAIIGQTAAGPPAIRVA